MNVFQLVFVAFCTLQLCLTVVRFRRAPNWVAPVFAAGWVAAIVLLLNPMIATDLAAALGIGRGVDLVLYTLSFIFLWAHYQHYLRYKRIEENVTLLVRELALQRAAEPDAISASMSDQPGSE